MKTYSVHRPWRLTVLLVFVALGIYGLGWYSGERMAAVGKLPVKPVANTRKIPAQSASLPTRHSLADIKNTLAELIKLSNGKFDQDKFFEFLRGVDAESIKALLEDPTAKALLDKTNPINVRASLLRCWARLDPHAALNWATSHEFANKDWAVNELFDAWAMEDPRAAFGALAQVKGGLHERALDAVMQRYLDQDPAKAFAALRTLPLVQTADEYTSVLEIWSGKDPAAAAAAALTLPPSATRDEALVGIADRWASANPTAALAWINTLPAGAVKDQALVATLNSMSRQDPAAVAASLASYNLPAGDARASLLQGIATNFAEQDPAGALAWADKNLVGADFLVAATSALQQISKTDPAAAAAYLANITDADVLHAALPQIVAAWSKEDPEAAIAWAQGLPGDNLAMRNTAVASVFSTWIDSDPVSAGNYLLQNMAADPSFKTLTVQVATNLAHADPQAAFAWALTVPAGTNGARINAITAALSAMANVDPQTALQDAQQLSRGSVVHEEASVISAWANQQPAQAAAALQILPNDGNLTTATGNVAKSWLAQDPNAASQWIDTLPPGAPRDAAVNQIITTVGQNDPAAAFNWATTISDETTRNAQIVKLAAQWSSQNPAAAAAAAQTALANLGNLTEAQQAALQKIVNKGTSH